MKMRKKMLYGMVGLTFLLGSCSKGAPDILDPSIPIYQNLAVMYDITDNTTSIGATFNAENASGTALRMQEKGVLFNGKEPSFIGGGDYMYIMQETGAPAVTFTLVRENVGTFVNSASIDDVEPISLNDTLSRIGTVNQIYWVGEPIGANETVSIHLQYDGGETTQTETTEGYKGIQAIFLDLPKSGTIATLSISRVKTLPLQESNDIGGGKINVSYTTSKKVTIK